MVLVFCIFSQLNADDYHYYELNLLNSFSIGRNENQFGVIKEEAMGYGGPDGPTALNFIDDQLVIVDALNNRIVELDDTYRFTNTIFIPAHIEFNGQLMKSGEIYLYYSSRYMIMGFYEDGELIFNYNQNFSDDFVFKNSNSMLDFLYLQNDLIFFEENNSGQIILFDDLQDRINDFEPVRESLSNFSSSLDQEMFQTEMDVSVHFDDMNRLIVSDDISTLDYKTFLEYWKDKQESHNFTRPETEITVNPEKFTRGYSLFYIGKDNDGNYYWSIDSGSVLIFNKNGYLIENFVVNDRKTKAIPTVHSSGDVFFIGWDNRDFYLYNVPRVW